MLRIAVISAHTCPLAPLGEKETGGMNVYILETTKHLVRYRIYVDVFTRLQDPALQKIVHLSDRARIIHIPAGPKGKYDKYIFGNHIDEFVKGIFEFHNEEGVSYDLIHSHYWLSGWVAMALNRVWKVPLIHMNHTLGQVTNLFALNRGEMERPIRIEVEKSVNGLADRIVASSPMEKAHLVWFYGVNPSKISIIPCGVNLQLFRKRDRKEARKQIGLDNGKWILYVGRIHPLKGIEYLIKALRILIDEFDFSREEIRLLIIGGNHRENRVDLNKLRRLSSSLKIDEIVFFKGSQSHQDLPAFYNAVDLLVIPSRYESFGMVALEAMACGTPVIASKAGGLIYTVEDNVTGFLVPYGDPYCLAERISLILKNSCLAEKFGQNGIERANLFSWERVVQMIINLYNLLSKKSIPSFWNNIDEG
jgi:D-inositol-3-phosphate glycosyltransferase